MATAPLVLPGRSTPQWVKYAVVDGMAVMEGDIVLGPANSVALRYSGFRGFNSGHASQKNGEMPYEYDSSISSAKAADIQAAIASMNETGVIKIRPRAPSDVDYLVFRDNGQTCSSNIGRFGGPQIVDSWCARNGDGVLHELMHAAGFYHEHSRMDRDQFVTIVWDEIIPEWKWVFEKRDASGQDIGAYDYESVMHYPPVMFSKTGNPTIVPRVAAAIGEWHGLSASDKMAVQTLYARGGVAPSPAPEASPQPPPVVFPIPTQTPWPFPAPSFQQWPNPFGFPGAVR